MCQSTEVDSKYTFRDLDIFLVRLHRGVPVRCVCCLKCTLLCSKVVLFMRQSGWLPGSRFLVSSLPEVYSYSCRTRCRGPHLPVVLVRRVDCFEMSSYATRLLPLSVVLLLACCLPNVTLSRRIWQRPASALRSFWCSYVGRRW